MTDRDAQGHFVSSDSPTEDVPQPNTPENPREAGDNDASANPLNHTVPYGSDANHPQPTQPKETAEQFAERGIIEKHGEAIRQNPQFDSMVKEEQRQNDENAKATEGM